MSDELTLEQRIERLEKHCADQELEFELYPVHCFEEDDSDTWTCFIGGTWIDTLDGKSLIIEAAENYLSLNQEHVAEIVPMVPPQHERAETQPIYPEDKFDQVDPDDWEEEDNQS